MKISRNDFNNDLSPLDHCIHLSVYATLEQRRCDLQQNGARHQEGLQAGGSSGR